jgi:hypothetical protein
MGGMESLDLGELGYGEWYPFSCPDLRQQCPPENARASAVLHHLTNELKNALDGTNLSIDWEGKTLLLLWVLFQGGAAATEETRKWD